MLKSHLFIAVAISALAGGGLPLLVFSYFFGRFLGVVSEEGIEMEFWVVLGGFRQPKNGLGRLPVTEKRTTMKKKLQIQMFSKDLGC